MVYRITNLNTDLIAGFTSEFFHGPFGGSDCQNLINFGDYSSRYFYIFSDTAHVIHQILSVIEDMCLGLIIKAIWKSTSQYESIRIILSDIIYYTWLHKWW